MKDVIEQDNAAREADLRADYDALGAKLARRGVDIEALTDRAMGFGVAVPSWGTGTGGTRFARFPGEGEPRGIMGKLDDCGVIHALTGATPRVILYVTGRSSLSQSPKRPKFGDPAGVITSWARPCRVPPGFHRSGPTPWLPRGT